jgi:hypothetical protein
MNQIGEPISSLPVPKLSEASHGMCKSCGSLWLEQAMQEIQLQAVAPPLPVMAEMSGVY